MRFKVCTTFAPQHWATHARRCVETFGKHWPAGEFELLAWVDQDLEEQSPWLAAFKKRHAHRPTDNYRMDAVRFAHKVAAIELAAGVAKDEGVDVLIWMDADCVTHADITADWLAKLLRNGDFAYLHRAKKYPECGFMMFRLNQRGTDFIDEIVKAYASDWLFTLPEWHDSYVIDRVRAKREATGMLRCVSLSGAAANTGHPLINGPLGERLDHLKGPRKALGKSKPSDLKIRRKEDYWRAR